MSNNQLVVKSIGQQCQIYKSNHQQLKQSEKKINKIIEENTLQERETVKKAIDDLNKKINTIVESNEVKNEVKKMEENHKAMMLSLKSVINKFNQGRKLIMERKDVPLQKKRMY